MHLIAQSPSTFQGSRSYFRGNWAVGGEPLVDGAETILHNHRFIHAARELFGSSTIRPTFIVVNLNAPMPAGPTHVDVPTFRGVTRQQYPLGWLIAMGRSELFERWRVIQAGAVSWFYDGPGGNFEYWPEGLGGPMQAEKPPFRNIAIMADNDRMYHRIGRVGAQNAPLPQMTAAAELRAVGDDTWAIVENGEVQATYPFNAVRLSLVWKANLETEADSESLDLDQVMSVFSLICGSEKLIFVSPGTRCPIRHGLPPWTAPTVRFQMRLIQKNKTRLNPSRILYLKIARRCRNNWGPPKSCPKNRSEARLPIT